MPYKITDRELTARFRMAKQYAEKNPDLAIANLSISVRTHSALVAARLYCIREVGGLTDEELLSLPGFGPISLRELHKVLFDPWRADEEAASQLRALPQ